MVKGLAFTNNKSGTSKSSLRTNSERCLAIVEYKLNSLAARRIQEFVNCEAIGCEVIGD
jgi:hypothetical protein